MKIDANNKVAISFYIHRKAVDILSKAFKQKCVNIDIPIPYEEEGRIFQKLRLTRWDGEFPGLNKGFTKKYLGKYGCIVQFMPERWEGETILEVDDIIGKIKNGVDYIKKKYRMHDPIGEGQPYQTLL